jgi:hypothetical protein
LDLVGITPTPTAQLPVRVASGEVLRSSCMVVGLEWWAQGFTFHTDMRVLNIAAYDAILGYDWLKKHSPMVFHWELKTMEFVEGNQQVHIQGIRSNNIDIFEISID